MKESKCGRIPPCYGSLEFAIYEEAKKVNEEWKKSRALHGKLIDKLRAKLMEGGFLDEIIYDGMDIVPIPTNHSKFDNIVMKEKKTKKMTKAEAFEHLKGTKVFCKDYDKMEAVQDFLRSLGFYWGDASEEMVLTHTIFLHKDGRLSFALSLQYFREHESPELSADDILSIEVVEDEPLDKWDDFARRVAKIQETLEDDEVCIITKGNFLTMTK